MKNMKSDKKVAIIGATGMVGRTMLDILAEREFPVADLRLFSSAKSAGTTMTFKGKEYVVEELTAENAQAADVDIALFSAGSEISYEFAPIFAENAVVIDNSSAWRMYRNVPLCVPEVNPDTVKGMRDGIIANPNCTTIQAVVALLPIYKEYGIVRANYTSFQAVSGAGRAGIDDLERTARGEPAAHFPRTIAGNCIPHIGEFEDIAYTVEETKMIRETRKIFGNPNLQITATAVRVPVITGHSIAINVTLLRNFRWYDLHRVLSWAKGIVVLDSRDGRYITPLEVVGTDEVYIGRLRRDLTDEAALHMWVVADNLRKGAALNAVQIAEIL
ncbi:MAG: aspartate-semialdehyde dehydrogenase [Turicibacter sp.]|nr:aspartate-semialdehyde dehydrogenase [Turicibacter sp.]